MTQKLLCTFGFIALVMAAVAAVPANAQTTANGPYYAIPSWDQKLPASSRFIVLSNWNNEAVLDRETGLVWERSPSNFGTTWRGARNYCRGLSLGDRMGWRLPTLQEALSLIDPTQSPSLPAGHPFIIEGGYRYSYWTTTKVEDSDDGLRWCAWTGFDNWRTVICDEMDVSGFAWCVRGGQGPDSQ